MTNAVLAQPMEDCWFAPEAEQAASVQSAAADQLHGWLSSFASERSKPKTSTHLGGFPWYSGVMIGTVDPVPSADLSSNRALFYDPTQREIYDTLTDFASERARLERVYVHADDEAVKGFLSRHRTVAGLLLEGASALKASFGDDTILRLQVLPGDEHAGSIYALVSWEGSARDARNALAKFDETWWVKNADRVAGRITFDYRLA
jgi:hypothetical protein